MVELSVLRGVVGCLWTNSIKAGLILIDVLIFVKVPHISSSADEDTTFRIASHYVCMGPFLLGIGFIVCG